MVKAWDILSEGSYLSLRDGSLEGVGVEERTETEYFCITKQDLETKKEDSSTQESCMRKCPEPYFDSPYGKIIKQPLNPPKSLPVK